jgi:DNA-binding MltR family transcriptional regulator
MASPPESIPRTAAIIAVIHELLRVDTTVGFSRQTERGAALSVVAELDNALQETIGAWLVNDTSVQDGMFREMQPLSTLGAKIRIAYLLGIFSRTIYNDLVAINRIRNEFAHNIDASDFKYPRILSLTNNLSTIRIYGAMLGIADHRDHDQTIASLFEGVEVPHLSSPAWRFTQSVLLCKMIIAQAKLSPPERKEPPF